MIDLVKTVMDALLSKEQALWLSGKTRVFLSQENAQLLLRLHDGKLIHFSNTWSIGEVCRDHVVLQVDNKKEWYLYFTATENKGVDKYV